MAWWDANPKKSKVKKPRKVRARKSYARKSRPSLATRILRAAKKFSMRRSHAGWRGESGEAAAVVDRLVHSVDKLVVYVCGGGGTVNAVRDALVKKGMDRKSVKWEKFW